MSTPARSPHEIYISHADVDASFCAELEIHFVPLVRAGVLRLDSDRRAAADGGRDTHLGAASTLLLLISRDYLASDRFKGILGPAMRRSETGSLRVVPVLLRPCYWKTPPLVGLAPLPSNGVPVTLAENRDQAWLDIVEGLLPGIPDAPQGPASSSLPAPPPEILERMAFLEELEEARRRRAAAKSAGLSTAVLDAEVKELKTRLRNGGLRENDVLDERYLLLKKIGHGGFGTVWEAVNRETGDRVAVKVLYREFAVPEKWQSRFASGTKAMQALHHPAVVRVIQPAGEDDGYHFAVLELVRGGNLHDAVLRSTTPASTGRAPRRKPGVRIGS